MTTDTTALQERIARAIRLADTGDTLPDGFAARMWDEGVTNRDKEMRLAAAVLPIIAAEVQAASKKAWEEGWEDRNTPDGYAWDGEQDVPLTSSRYDNPYCAAEYETGERA